MDSSSIRPLYRVSHVADRLFVEIASLLEDAQQRGRNEVGDAPERALGQVVALHQRLVPDLNVRRAVNDLVQGLFANLGVGICQQRCHGGHVGGGDDGVGDRRRNPLTPGDGVERALNGTAGHDL